MSKPRAASPLEPRSRTLVLGRLSLRLTSGQSSVLGKQKRATPTFPWRSPWHESRPGALNSVRRRLQIIALLTTLWRSVARAAQPLPASVILGTGLFWVEQILNPFSAYGKGCADVREYALGQLPRRSAADLQPSTEQRVDVYSRSGNRQISPPNGIDPRVLVIGRGAVDGIGLFP